MGEAGNERASAPHLRGVDLFRFLGALLVIQLHSAPDGADGVAQAWALPITVFCRCAVPFFFVASGFFLRQPAAPGAAIVTRPLRRLLPVYGAWLMIYELFFTLVPPPAYLGWRPRWSDIYTGGIAYQLWFMPVLGFSQVLVVGGRALIGRRGTLAVVLAIAAVGLAGGAYHGVLHLPGSAHKVRVFSGPLLVFVGTQLAERRIRVTPRAGALMVAAAYLLLFGENWLLGRAAGGGIAENEFSLGTILFGTAMFLWAVSLRLEHTRLPVRLLARMSLGIYCIHVLFLWLLLEPIGSTGFRQAELLAAAVAACSIAAVALIVRVPFVRRLSG